MFCSLAGDFIALFALSLRFSPIGKAPNQAFELLICDPPPLGSGLEETGSVAGFQGNYLSQDACKTSMFPSQFVALCHSTSK